MSFDPFRTGPLTCFPLLRLLLSARAGPCPCAPTQRACPTLPHQLPTPLSRDHFLGAAVALPLSPHCSAGASPCQGGTVCSPLNFWSRLKICAPGLAQPWTEHASGLVPARAKGQEKARIRETGLPWHRPGSERLSTELWMHLPEVRVRFNCAQP